MTSRKKLLKEARILFKTSLTDNFVDENKVKKILKVVSLKKSPRLLKILKNYKRLIEQKTAQEELVIETETGLKQTTLTKKLMAKTKAIRIIYKINPKMIFGAKVSHGDWIWDATLDAKLAQLTNEVRS